jgi:hypothetical protein
MGMGEGGGRGGRRGEEGEVDWVEVGGEVVSVVEAGEVVEVWVVKGGVTPSNPTEKENEKRFVKSVSPGQSCA